MILRRLIRHFIGDCFEAIHFPGMIQPFEHNDHPNGVRVSLKTSRYYTKLYIGGYEFFFQ